MKSIKDIKVVYFIGIGGIGMSALARFFKRKGKAVYGYDRSKTKLTQQLQSEGIQIHFEDDVKLLREDADLVVYTPAIPTKHKQLSYYLQGDFQVKKRSEVLGMISEGTYTVGIAGTHGKTTITAILAHILKHSDKGCTAFIGGISKNYRTNFLFDNEDIMIVEADEYDRSFLQLSPDLAVVSSVDADHLDIYKNLKGVRKGFSDFISKVRTSVLLNADIKDKVSLANGTEFQTYHTTSGKSDYHALNLLRSGWFYLYDLQTPHGKMVNWLFPATGLHNLENAIAATALALNLGISETSIKRALYDFQGIKRRFEYIHRSQDLTIIDDYAHHPKEIAALIKGARQLHKGKYLCIAFQPHLYSRTQDLADDFAKELSKADEVLLLDIYPAREEPISGVSSSMLAERMAGIPVSIISKEELPQIIETNNKIELLLISGAGDIDKCVDNIKTLLKKS